MNAVLRILFKIVKDKEKNYHIAISLLYLLTGQSCQSENKNYVVLRACCRFEIGK